nr:hypothetical protein [Clostridiales bacterium]
MNKILKRSAVILLTVTLMLGGFVLPVSADVVPDKGDAVDMKIGGSMAYISNSDSATYKITPSMESNYVIKSESYYFMNPAQDIKINVYDEDLKLIKSGIDQLSLWLEKESYYFTVERTDGKPIYMCNVWVEPDFEISVTTDGRMTQLIGKGYPEDDYFSYEYLVQKNKELKVDMKFLGLPSNTKYTYQWYYDSYSDSSGYTKLDSTQPSVTLKADRGMLRCDITDQSSGTYKVFFSLIIDPNMCFKEYDGDFVREIKAWETLEGRTSVFPDITIDGGSYDQIYYILLVEGFTNQIDYNLGNPKMNLPDDCNEVVYYQIAFNSTEEKMLRKIMYYFIINDSTANSIELGETVHIDREEYDEKIAQEVFSFTPQVSGKYKFYSSDLKKGNPVVAVFDDSLSCIAFNSDVKSDYNIEDIRFRDFNKYLDE